MNKENLKITQEKNTNDIVIIDNYFPCENNKKRKRNLFDSDEFNNTYPNKKIKTDSKEELYQNNKIEKDLVIVDNYFQKK